MLPLCTYFHACVNGRECKLSVHYPHPLPIHKRFLVLGQIMQHEEAKSQSEHFHDLFSSLPRFTRRGGVSDSGTPHLKHSSVPDSVSSNKRHRETTGPFSVITQKSLPILGAPHLDVNASGDWEASFAFARSTRMNKKWG